jgi:hypothetical protein
MNVWATHENDMKALSAISDVEVALFSNRSASGKLQSC